MKLFAFTTLLAAIFCSPLARAQNGEISMLVQITGHNEGTHTTKSSAANVVVWLSPLQKINLETPHPKRDFTLTQRDRQFTPHVLVVPTGASVNFPNLDPFFHNVFSLFNGKRFDLGLYEEHTSRKVQFDREGISYIFCNIHPEMGAVVVSLSTPYYALSSPSGLIQLHGIPPGSYRLNIWAENVSLDRLAQLSRTVEITPATSRLEPLSLEVTYDLMAHHKNKFGEDYSPTAKTSY